MGQIPCALVDFSLAGLLLPSTGVAGFLGPTRDGNNQALLIVMVQYRRAINYWMALRKLKERNRITVMGSCLLAFKDS